MTVYLDNAATTKPLDSVIDIIIPYLKEKWHNPSSLYSDGMRVKHDINNARIILSDFINSNAEEIFFTSGSTESNNWVIRGWDDANYKNDSIIITTPIEHRSIIDAVNNPVLHSKVYFCDVDNYGLININSLEELLKKNKDKQILVSVIMANNEIGTIQNIKMITDIVHKYNGVFHSDATQALGQIPINVEELGIDMMSASAQKLGGLKGTGFLYKKNGIELCPLIYGSQENEMRGGTENVIGIIGFAEAVKHLKINDKESFKNNKLLFLRNHFINKLMIKFNCRVNGSTSNRLPNNINVTFPQNISGESLIYALDMCDIFISAGSACNSHEIEPSHVLKAIGLSDEETQRTIRISISESLTTDDIDKVISEIDKQIKIMTM